MSEWIISCPVFLVATRIEIEDRLEENGDWETKAERAALTAWESGDFDDEIRSTLDDGDLDLLRGGRIKLYVHVDPGEYPQVETTLYTFDLALRPYVARSE